MRHQVAFGEQLLVRFDDHAARERQLLRQCPCRRQLRVRCKPSRLDGPTQLAFELQPHRHAAAPGDVEQQLRP
jgi:hypothetical protein